MHVKIVDKQYATMWSKTWLQKRSQYCGVRRSGPSVPTDVFAHVTCLLVSGDLNWDNVGATE